PGALLLALVSGRAVGTVALRALGGGRCEMKRLYVQPAFRGGALGRLLAEGIVGEARRLGYRSMVLDTVAQMIPAIALYESLGFRETAPYTDNPLDGARFFELDLAVRGP